MADIQSLMADPRMMAQFAVRLGTPEKHLAMSHSACSYRTNSQA
jgi:hypothetical protein